MKNIPFESSQWDESNDTKFVKIQSLDAKIDQNVFKYLAWINLVNINITDMKYMPFESFQWDDYNDTKIIKIQSLDTKIIAKPDFYFILYKII